MMTKSNVMKGYYVPCGYMGYINGNYRLFATESEYVEVWEETNRNGIT